MIISKKKLLTILFLGFIFIVSSTEPGSLCFASDFKMVKHLTVSIQDSYPDSVMSWRGNFDIDGTVKGTIILFGGQLELDGIVEEDVICVSSTIHLGEKAVIKGDLFVIEGKLNRHPQSIIEGKYFFYKFDIKKIESTILPIFSDSGSLTFFIIIKVILWIIISLLVFAVLPKQINHAEEIFETNILRIALMGLLSLFTFLFLLIAFGMMSLIIIGIPLLFLLVIFYFLIYIFGKTVVFYFIGIKLSKLLKIKNITPALFIVMGVIIYSILKFIPLMGPLVLILMNLFEVGISVGFLLRKKLKLQA